MREPGVRKPNAGTSSMVAGLQRCPQMNPISQGSQSYAASTHSESSLFLWNALTPKIQRTWHQGLGQDNLPASAFAPSRALSHRISNPTVLRPPCSEEGNLTTGEAMWRRTKDLGQHRRPRPHTYDGVRAIPTSPHPLVSPELTPCRAKTSG